MEIKEVEMLLDPVQISNAVLEIARIIIDKQRNQTMSYAESCREMVLAVAPHLQFPMQPFTEAEINAAEENSGTGATLSEFCRYLVEGRKQVMHPRQIKLNALAAEINAMTNSGRQYSPMDAADLLLGTLERLEEQIGVESK